MTNYINKIALHYSSCWSDPAAVLRWQRGPIEEVRPEFRVLVIPRSVSTIAFATVGMSDPTDKEALELHVLTKPGRRLDEQESVVELLAAVSHYHRTEYLLNVGHTVDFGRGWIPGSACSCGLVSLPYLDGPRLEWMDVPSVRFLWLIPITPAERDIKRSKGLEELEERFETEQVDLFDPMRRPVA